MSASPQIVFNPLDPEFLRNPYPTYRQLQTYAPVFQTPLGVWLVTRYHDVNQILRGPEFVRRFADMARRRAGDRVATSPAFQSLSRWFLVLNPPDHTRLRSLAAKAFTSRRVEDLRPRIQATVDRLIDGFIDHGQGDLVQLFNRPLPIIVICELLGIPEDDWARFMDDSCLPPQFLEPRPLSSAEIDEMDTATLALNEYLGALCEKRRAEPRDDLTTALVQAEEAGDRMTHDELVATLVMLFFAGHETTVNLLGNGLLALFQHPEQLARLRADLSMVPNTVEEMLRYDNAAQLAGLRCTTKAMTLGDTELPEGAQLIPVVAAANRDPAVFENPDQFDIGRSFAQFKPLSFGGGIHYCVGAQLARVEAAIAVETILRRLPGLSLENLDAPAWRPSFSLRGLVNLPATW